MNTLITYDLQEKVGEQSRHSEVKNAMKALGYLDNFTIESDNPKVTYYLPNTSLWKENISSETARTDLLNVAKQKGAIVERLVATNFSSVSAIQGKPYSNTWADALQNRRL